MKKYKYVYANGCSYTHGEGLNYISHYNKTGEWKNSDMGISDDERDEKYRKKWRYSKLLADKLGCKEINKACNGTSMDRAYRLITDFILTDERAKDSLIVWQLTYIERGEQFRNLPVGNFESYPPGYDSDYYLYKEIKWLKAYDKYYFHPVVKLIDFMKKILFLDSYCKENDIGLVIFDGLLGIDHFGHTESEQLEEHFHPEDVSNFRGVIDKFYERDIIYPICGESFVVAAQEKRHKKYPKIVNGAYTCAELDNKGKYKDTHPGKDMMIDIAESIYNKIVKGDIND